MLLAVVGICHAQDPEQEVAQDSVSLLKQKLPEIKKDSEKVKIYVQLVEMLDQENAELSESLEEYEKNPDLLLLTDSISVFRNNVPVDQFSPALLPFANAIEKVSALQVALQNMNEVLATFSEVSRKDRSLDYNGFLNTRPVQEQMQELSKAATEVDVIDRRMFSEKQNDYIDKLIEDYNKLLIEIYQ